MNSSDDIVGGDLDRASRVPLHRQIYQRIADAVLDGRLPPGSRLPSARSLAAQLAIARSTVDMAYQLLAGEGYVATRGAAGTVVDPALDQSLLNPGRIADPAIAAAPPAAEDPATRGPEMLRPGLPALDAFPYKTWARLVAQQARAAGPADLAYQTPAGDEWLRIQIGRYLAVARGIACEPEDILITSGYQGALGLIARCLLGDAAAVWVENPTYHLARDALRLAGARPVGIPVDGEGFDIGYATTKAEPARMAVLTPTHQFPLGVSLSLARRMALLKWATAAQAWIVEDDYDSEFRYQGRPLPALKSLDRRDRVIYVGTFSKILSPGLRVGYMVVPKSLVRRFTEAAGALQPPPTALVQATIAAFLERGYMARHIRRMRRLYAKRRDALADALTRQMGADLTIDRQPGGMHLLARLPQGTDDVALVARLNEMGIAPAPLSACGVDAPYGPGLIIGFTNIEAAKAPEAARRLAQAMR